MLVTKHCSPEVREYLLKGHFRIGTLSDYRRQEGGGLLDDNDEGRGSMAVGTGGRDLHNFSLSLPGVRIVNATMIRSGYPFVSDNIFDASVFCASAGGYAEARHQSILHGSDNYKSNPECTAFIVLDMDRLAEALTVATTEVYGTIGRWLYERVSYAPRNLLVTIPATPWTDFRFDAVNEFKRLAFTKPTRFCVEEEFRFVELPRKGEQRPRVILTKDLSVAVQQSFADAIVDAGSDVPRTSP